MISFNQFVTEHAESRRDFLKKLGKGLAVATSGIKPDLSAVKKVDYLSKPVIGHAPYDRDFDSYDAISYALDNMFEFGRASCNLSMPMKLQQQLGNKLQYMIIGHKYASSPGGPSSLRPTDYDFYSDLMDNADEYGDMDEAIASTSATLQDVFDYKKIFKGADNIWKEKGMEGVDDIEKYIKDNVEGYIEADKEGDTCYEGEPEPVDEDPRDYLERDYASGPHMNSFKPEMSFKQFYLTEGPDVTGHLGPEPPDPNAGPAAAAARLGDNEGAIFIQGGALVQRRSGISGNLNKIFIKGLTKDQFDKWRAGEHIQAVMPSLSPDEREFLKTGITPEEWNKMFPDEDETDEEMPETPFGGPGEAEAANKGKEMRANIPEQPNVDGAPPIINNPGPNYANQPSLGQVKNRTYKNKNLVSGLFKTNV